MRKQHPILVELQAADLVLALAGRERPHGYKSPLADYRGAPNIDDHQIAHAVMISHMVNSICPDHVRRTVSLAMAVDRGVPMHSRKSIAHALRTSEASVKRWLNDGLRQVENMLIAVEQSPSDLHAVQKRQCA